MAPTICSGKKRQTRTIATTEIRRHGQRSQLNQALSNIVNYVAKGSTNPRVSASLRIQTHNPTENNTTGNQHQHHNANNDASTNNTNNHSHKHSIQTSATLAANHRRQQFSSISDNAVTSSTHSDTENSYDLRLTNETLVNNGSTTTNSSNINSSSSLTFPSTSLSSTSSHKEMSSPLCEERRFQRYSSSATTSSSVSHVQANDLNDENDVTEDNNNYSTLNAEANKKHSKHFFKYSDDDDDEDMMNGDDDVDSTYASDTDSMTSLDTEKSAELKRGNHPQWRDKYCTKSLTNASNSNTDGLLSIAIKTIKLVKRNQLLQQRLTQLQLETTEFIESVLANPENRHFRENIKQKVKEVENV